VWEWVFGFDISDEWMDKALKGLTCNITKEIQPCRAPICLRCSFSASIRG